MKNYMSLLLMITTSIVASDKQIMVTCADSLVVEHRLQENGLKLFCGNHLARLSGKTVDIHVASKEINNMFDEIYANKGDLQIFQRHKQELLSQSRNNKKCPRQIKRHCKEVFIKALVDDDTKNLQQTTAYLVRKVLD